jgi:hypothetical protein
MLLQGILSKWVLMKVALVAFPFFQLRLLHNPPLQKNSSCSLLSAPKNHGLPFDHRFISFCWFLRCLGDSLSHFGRGLCDPWHRPDFIFSRHPRDTWLPNRLKCYSNPLPHNSSNAILLISIMMTYTYNLEQLTCPLGRFWADLAIFVTFSYLSPSCLHDCDTAQISPHQGRPVTRDWWIIRNCTVCCTSIWLVLIWLILLYQVISPWAPICGCTLFYNSPNFEYFKNPSYRPFCIAKICILTRGIRDKVRIDGADTVLQSLWPLSEWHLWYRTGPNNK